MKLEGVGTYLALAFTLALPLAAASVDANADDAADALVRDFRASARAVLEQTAQKAQRELYDRLAQVVAETHDFALTAELSLGERWRELDEVQRSALIGVFQKRCIATYAARPVELLELPLDQPQVQEISADQLLLRYALPGTSREGALEYRLQRVAEAWRIIDSSLDGVGRVLDPRAVQDRIEALGVQGFIQELERRARTPSEVVAALQESLLEVMQRASDLGYAGRYAELEGVIDETHSIGAIARLSIGRSAWKTLDEEQGRLLIGAFRNYSIAAYAGRFDAYGGERFRLEEERVVRAGVVMVKSLMIKSDGQEIHFDYLVHWSKGRWLILNIIVDGVSDLALKRAEYGKILKKKSFEALLSKLKDQVRDYEHGDDD